jgi:tetratricopeptide (TPR) repeat protein
MNEAHDPNRTVDVTATPVGNEPHDPGHTVAHSSAVADSLDAGLIAGFGPPRSSLGDMRPVLLKEAEGDSAHIVKPHSDAMPSPEQTGDRYQFQGEIARGGMGAVLRGRDVDLGRDLAVKVLLEKHANRPEVARRFIEEAQIGGQLQHPGVVPVYDVGRFGERPFFTMKLVKGQTLAALLGERTDPAADRPQFLDIALKVAQTLAYAHAKGVIHRDLKPANIMVGAFGEVQVMDWGLAKVLAEGGIADEERARRLPAVEGTQIRTARSSGSGVGTDTEAGSLLGTPAYMPPEQANGDVALLDRRADVFGLGAILCEILTGKPPYVGRSAEEVRRKACNGDLAAATTRLDACGADVEIIVLTKSCLAAEAIDRPKDAQAVADGLSYYQGGVQERLQAAQRERAVAVARESEQRKRRKVQLALAAAVVALLVGGGAFAWWRNAQVQASRERDARNAVAVAALLGQAEEALKAGDAAKATVALEAARKRSAEGGAEQEAERLGRLQADLALVRDLDEVDQFRWIPSDNKLPDAAVVATRTREALARFGIDPEAVSVDEAAARVSASVVSERIVSALDRLLLPIRLVDVATAIEQKAETLQVKADLAALLPKTAGVRALLRRVDADPYRDAMRDAVHDAVLAIAAANNAEGKMAAVNKAAAKVAELAGQPAALEQPPGFVAFLGVSAPMTIERRRHLLETALRRRPGDLHLLMTLAYTYPINQEDGANERLRWLQAAVAAAPGNAAAHVSLGLALRDNKDLAGAEAAARKAVELAPTSATAHSSLGIALRDNKDLAGAEAAFRKALELDPKDAKVHNSLGVVLSDKGKVDEAIACYKKAIELDANYAGPHNNLGGALYRKGQVDEAIACYRQAIALDPKFALAHSNLGMALRDKGQVDEAIACYKKAIALDPKFAQAHVNLGAIYCDVKRDYGAAITCFRTAINLDPNSAKAHSNLGVALAGKGQVDEAIACHKKAIELDPKFAHAHSNMGTALAQKGKRDDAIAGFRKAIELDPRDADAHNGLGNALKDKGQLDEAIACFKKAIELDPKYTLAHARLGASLALKGKLDEAIAFLKKAIELDPKFAEAHSDLGSSLARKGQLDEAVACHKKAIALDPKFAKAHHNLGVTLKMKGRLDEAIACHKKAIALDPKYVLAHYNLGASLTGKGQLDEAIASFKKAIELNPRFAEAHCYLGHALRKQGQFADALAALKRGHELGTKQPGWPYPSAEWVREAEQLVALEAKLLAFLKGELKPKDATERLGLVGVCQAKKLHHAAARLFADTFAGDPELADDLMAGHRYKAACSAALAAAGQGADAGTLGGSQRQALRRQALTWLRGELPLWTRLFASGAVGRSRLAQILSHWQQDSDLAGLRHKDALAKLPAEERAACEKLWADVAALLKKAQEKPK